MSKKILNQLQSAEEARALTIKTYMELTANKTICMGYNPLKRGYNSFLGHYEEFELEAKNKAKSKAGTATKGEQKISIAHHLAIVLGLTKDYAVQSKNTSMKVLVSYSETKIRNMADGDILPFINNLKEKVFTTALFANLDFIKYEVTSIEFDGIVTDAQTFNDTRGEVTEDDNSSSTSNDKMDTIIDLIHQDFESMDKSVNRLADENPDFASGYYKNKVLTVFGIRHEGVQGVVRVNGVIEPDATVGVVGSDKIVKVTSDASYVKYKVPGTYTFIAKNSKGQSQTKIVTVTHRNMLDVDFDLASPPSEGGI